MVSQQPRFKYCFIRIQGFLKKEKKIQGFFNSKHNFDNLTQILKENILK